MKSRLIAAVTPILLLIFCTAQAHQVTGHVDYRVRIQIQPLISGTIVDVPVKVGDIVQKGQILIQFDSRWQETQARIVKSQIERLEIELKRVSDKFDRQQELFDRGSLSLLDFEEAEREVMVARSELGATRAELAAIQYQLQDTALLSPMDNAIVVMSNVHVGMNYLHDIYFKERLMTLGSHGQYVIRVNVPSEIRNTLQAGDAVSVKIDDSIYTAYVEFPTLDPEFELFTVSDSVMEGEAASANSSEYIEKPIYAINISFSVEQESILLGTPAVVLFN